MENTGNPPESLGQTFIKAVERKDTALFQHLVSEAGYMWGIYFKCLRPEEQEWAVANRPRTVDFKCS